MARVSLEHKVPQIVKPVGSRDEVESLAGDVGLRNISTCSRRQERTNFGCALYEDCDRDFRGTRPHNEGVRITTSDGNLRVQCMACFETVRKEREADAKGMLVEVIAQEGESITYRGSVKMHPKREPTCNKCSEGKCEAYIDVEDLEMTIPKFPDAAEHRDLIKFARIRDARGRISANTKKALRRRIYGPEDEAQDEKPAAKKGDNARA